MHTGLVMKTMVYWKLPDHFIKFSLKVTLSKICSYEIKTGIQTIIQLSYHKLL